MRSDRWAVSESLATGNGTNRTSRHVRFLTLWGGKQTWCEHAESAVRDPSTTSTYPAEGQFA